MLDAEYIDVGPDPVQLDVLAPDGRLVRAARIEIGEWRDPLDKNPLRREARTIRHWRIVSPLDRMARTGASNVTGRHVKAANRLAIDFEMSEGTWASSGTPDRVDGGGGGVGPSGAQLDALKRFRAARDAMGSGAVFVLAMALDQMTVEDLARRNVCRLATARLRLMDGLGMLLDHYDTLDDGKRPVAAPVVVADVVDERVGRWR